MVERRRQGRGRFGEVAAGYQETMVPSLRPVAARVVERAGLRPGESVLDLGTGTGIGAAAALGDGREVTGVDVAEPMLELARPDAPGARFLAMDFERLAFPDGAFDCLLAVHALLFAGDRVLALREWRRVARPGGRLSLSVPGPDSSAPARLYGRIYARHGIRTEGRYPDPDDLAAMASDAGWTDADLEVDASHEIVLADDDAFRLWRSIGSRGAATADWPPERHEALTREMLEVTPRGPDGSLHIPFGVIYLSASA